MLFTSQDVTLVRDILIPLYCQMQNTCVKGQGQGKVSAPHFSPGAWELPSVPRGSVLKVKEQGRTYCVLALMAENAS